MRRIHLLAAAALLWATPALASLGGSSTPEPRPSTPEVPAGDMPTVRHIVRDAKAHDYTFESIVMGVVNSDAFRRRAPAAPPPNTTTAQVSGG